MKSDKIKALLALSGKKNKDYCECLGITRQSMSKKKKVDSFSTDDLIKLGNLTDMQLAFIDKNNHVIIAFDMNDLKK